MSLPSRRTVLRGGVASLFGGLTGCASSDSLSFWSSDAPSTRDVDEWPQFQRDGSNSGFSSALSAGGRYGRQQWQVEIDSGTNGYGGVGDPVVRDGLLYVGERSEEQYRLTALRIEDASREWSQPLRGRNETPAVADETVFVPTTNVVETNRVAALATADGSERWHFDFEGGRVTPIAHADGRLYVAQCASSDGTYPARVFALTEDGSELWRKRIEGDVEASVAVGREALYVGTTNETLHALDVETGESEWTMQTNGEIRCSPTVADESVFVADDSGKAYAVSTDGQRRWRESATAPNSGTGLAISSELVFVAGRDGLFALGKTDGKQRWSLEADWQVTTPTVGNGTVYVGIDDEFVAVQAGSGDRTWRRETGSVTSGDTIIEGVTSAPAIIDDELYVGTVSGLSRFTNAG